MADTSRAGCATDVRATDPVDSGSHLLAAGAAGSEDGAKYERDEGTNHICFDCIGGPEVPTGGRPRRRTKRFSLPWARRAMLAR